MGEVGFDTNILIYALERKDELGDNARQLLRKVENQSIKGSISVMVFHEVFVKVYKLKQQEKIPYLIDFLTAKGKIFVVDLTREVAMRAASLRAMYPSLRAPDAIHLASALEAKCKVFITADRKFPRTVDKLSIIQLK